MVVNALHRYPYPIDTVIGAFMDPDFYRAKFAAVGARSIEVLSSARDGDTFRIVVKREVPADVPGVLQSFLGAWNAIRQSERWERTGDEYCNKLEIVAAGVPVTLRGTMRLRPAGAQACENDVQMDIHSSVPLLGRKLTEFVAQNTARGLEDEHRAISAWLAGDR